MLKKKIENNELEKGESYAYVLKEAYANIQQIREILTNNVIHYRVYYNSDINDKSQFSSIDLSMDELLSHGVGDNLQSFSSHLQIAEDTLKSFANQSHRAVSATYFNNRLSKVQDYMDLVDFGKSGNSNRNRSGYLPNQKAIQQLAIEDLMPLVKSKKLKDFQQQLNKNNGSLNFLNNIGERKKYFRPYTLGHLGEGVDRSIDNESRNKLDSNWTIGKFTRNELRWDSVAGFKGGDVGDWQIKMGNARLVRSSTIKGYLTKLQKVFNAIQTNANSITTDKGNSVNTIQYVKNIFSESPAVNNQINTMIENSINGLMQGFTEQAQQNLVGNNANITLQL